MLYQLALTQVGPSTIGLSSHLLICRERLGWGSPQVIATLVLSVVVMGAFFGVERIVKEPALPLQTWTNKNFIPLFFYGWTAYWWLLGMELQLVDVFTVRLFSLC